MGCGSSEPLPVIPLPLAIDGGTTLIIDFRRDTRNIFSELTSQNYSGIHEAFKEFLATRLSATDMKDAKDQVFAPVKYKITHLVKYTGTRNNMSNIYCKMCDFMTAEQGWDLKSVTGINNQFDLGTLTLQKPPGSAVNQGSTTLIIDFRRDSWDIFVELTGEDYNGIHATVKEFLTTKLGATDARDAKDQDFAPVKYKITHVVKYTGTRNNMSNIYCKMCDFMSVEQGWDLKSVTGLSNLYDLGTLTLQKLPGSQGNQVASTLIIDFRRDSRNIFVELTGEDHNGIHSTFKEFLTERLSATDARDAKDQDFAPVKYKITHLVKYTGTRNNMSNIYCTLCDFMTVEQGWDLKSVTGINNQFDLGTLTFQKPATANDDQPPAEI